MILSILPRPDDLSLAKRVSSGLKTADYFHTWPCEHFLHVRRIWQFGRQILPGKVQLLVQVRTPLGAITHIVNNTCEGDQLGSAAFTGAATQFHLCDDAVWDVHKAIIQGKEKSPDPSGDFVSLNSA